MNKAHFVCKPTTMQDIPTTRRDMDKCVKATSSRTTWR